MADYNALKSQAADLASKNFNAEGGAILLSVEEISNEGAVQPFQKELSTDGGVHAYVFMNDMSSIPAHARAKMRAPSPRCEIIHFG